MKRILFTLILLVPVVTLAAPTGVAHSPVTSATMGDDLRLSVEVAGVPDGEPEVTLHFRGTGSGYSQRFFESVGQSLYEVTIPGTATNDLGLRYYIEIAGPEESYNLTFGSQQTPLTVDLAAPPAPVTSGVTTQLAIGFGVLLVIGGAFRLRQRASDRSLRETIFWVRILHPVAQLSRAEQGRELRRLCGTPLDHPQKGMTVFPRATLLRKLREVQELDVDRLIDLRQRHLASEPGFDLPPMKQQDREREMVNV